MHKPWCIHTRHPSSCIFHHLLEYHLVQYRIETLFRIPTRLKLGYTVLKNRHIPEADRWIDQWSSKTCPGHPCWGYDRSSKCFRPFGDRSTPARQQHQSWGSRMGRVEWLLPSRLHCARAAALLVLVLLRVDKQTICIWHFVCIRCSRLTQNLHTTWYMVAPRRAVHFMQEQEIHQLHQLPSKASPAGRRLHCILYENAASKTHHTNRRKSKSKYSQM